MVRAPWGYGLHLVLRYDWNTLESVIREGENPVQEVEEDEQYPSTVRHVEPGRKVGGPPPKAKYSLMTESGE